MSAVLPLSNLFVQFPGRVKCCRYFPLVASTTIRRGLAVEVSDADFPS